MSNSWPLTVVLEVGDSQICVTDSGRQFDQRSLHDGRALSSGHGECVPAKSFTAALAGLGGDCDIPPCFVALCGESVARLRDPRLGQDQQTRDKLQASVRKSIGDLVSPSATRVFLSVPGRLDAASGPSHVFKKHILRALPDTQIVMATQQKAALMGYLHMKRVVYGQPMRHGRYTMIHIGSAMIDVATIHIPDMPRDSLFEMGTLFARTCWLGGNAFSRHIAQRMLTDHCTPAQIAETLNHIEWVRREMAQLNNVLCHAGTDIPGPFPDLSEVYQSESLENASLAIQKGLAWFEDFQIAFVGQYMSEVANLLSPQKVPARGGAEHVVVLHGSECENLRLRTRVRHCLEAQFGKNVALDCPGIRPEEQSLVMRGLCVWARKSQPSIRPSGKRETSSSEPSAQPASNQLGGLLTPSGDPFQIAHGPPTPSGTPDTSTSDHDAIDIIRNVTINKCDRHARAPRYFTKAGLLTSTKRHLLMMQNIIGQSLLTPSQKRSLVDYRRVQFTETGAEYSLLSRSRRQLSRSSTNDIASLVATQPNASQEADSLNDHQTEPDDDRDQTFAPGPDRDQDDDSSADWDPSSPTAGKGIGARTLRRRLLNAHTHYALIRAISADDTDWSEPATRRAALAKLAHEHTLSYLPQTLGPEVRHDAATLERSCGNFILLQKVPEIGDNEYTREDLWELRLRWDYLVELEPILDLEAGSITSLVEAHQARPSARPHIPRSQTRTIPKKRRSGGGAESRAPPRRTRKRKDDNELSPHVQGTTKRRQTRPSLPTHIDTGNGNYQPISRPDVSNGADVADHRSSSGSLSPMSTTSFDDYSWADETGREGHGGDTSGPWTSHQNVSRAALTGYPNGRGQDGGESEQRAPVVPRMGTGTSVHAGQSGIAVVSRFERSSAGPGQKGVQVRRRLN
ncbi:hypothetical protein LTR97_012198 [Elasticomyces elasticus]|uniref:Actin-like ATPase domain-containing protein n=1 Tax=Elasticomyces elasticus TaxID=574655 RepID=A0AAN7VW53_9PEZI|nr:hypothetical protein LTR97_012198 [Elasticomyces elasticus]